jgi:hypothetical protein
MRVRYPWCQTCGIRAGPRVNLKRADLLLCSIMSPVSTYITISCVYMSVFVTFMHVIMLRTYESNALYLV